MKDPYSVLELGQGSSADQIKAAYRRLALLYHPDRLAVADGEARRTAADRMALVNEAYSQLMEAAPAASAREPVEYAAEVLDDAPTETRSFKRQTGNVVSCVYEEYATELLNRLVSTKGWRWHRLVLEGFDWALESSGWTSNSLIAFRGVTTLDAEALRRLTLYSAFATQKPRFSWRRHYFLIVVAFQKLQERDQLMDYLRTVWSSWSKDTEMVLIDMNRRSIHVCRTEALEPGISKLMTAACISAM